jgi:hypothetical protein
MNHLSRKKKLYGAGKKKPKVKPAVLLPPKIGEFQFGASFSFIETLDLISDGPIEGLVDSDGDLLNETELSRGVYLDGTPVAISVETDQDPESELSLENNTTASTNITTFSNLNAQGGSINDRKSLVKTFNDSDEGNLRESVSTITYQNFVKGLDPVIRGGDSRYPRFGTVDGSFGDSAFSNSVGPQFLKVENGRLGYYRTSDDIGVEGNSPNWDSIVQMLWNNNTTISNSDCFLCFTRANNSWYQNKLNQEGFLAAADTIFHTKLNQSDDVRIGGEDSSGVQFFQEILNKWASYGPASDGEEDTNPFMRTLIEQKMNKVFGSDRWKTTSAYDLSSEFFRNTNRWASGYMIAYVPNRNILNTVPAGLKFNDAREVSLIPTQNNDLPSPVFKDSFYKDLLIPICDKNGVLQESQDILGASFMFLENRYFGSTTGTQDFNINGLILKLGAITKLTITQTVQINTRSAKYNYNNVLLEFRKGYEDQKPFHYFNKIHIDKSVNKNVYGAFKPVGQVQRIKRDNANKKNDFPMDRADYSGPNLTLENGLPTNEGSNDNQRQGSQSVTKDYSSWNSMNNSYRVEERAAPITYYVINPNVSEVFVTLQIDSLFDTIEQSYRGDGDNVFKVGDKFPAIMNVAIEVGKVLSNGTLQQTLTKTYRISALVEGTTVIDIGNPSNINDPSKFKHIRDFQNLSGDADLSTPFPLPRVNDYSSNNSYSSPEKRYVKVSKLSTETFSVLISKELTFAKVTEIIPVNLKYPFSAIVGTKLDSKSFSSTPARSFDARLKLVLIPTNYFPTQQTNRKKDKRYYDDASELANASEEDKSVYQGDWSGGFKMGWTDNPAWILYDLLTNTRYGLGRYLDENDINKWELYKIGRFCDAVDSNGNFEGVPDGRGGLEPRYSCNIMFKSDEKVFDSIQLISKLFRGQTFFRASEVSFVDERIKSPVAIFNNNNVKDGGFNYSNLRRDQQFNTVEVSYLDRFENFTPKVEVVEDEEDIRSRGVFKKRIDGLGVTSRSMARRIGQHLIYKTIKENQRIAFTSGLEALLCQPGDLILIDDDLKNEKSNFGKVLSVDVDNQYIQLSGPYSADSMTGILTVYNPTGETSISGLNDIAETKRARTDTFTITGVPSVITDFNTYTGLYNFSGYTDGYTSFDIEELSTFSEYALYTGTGDNMLYFSTDYTGWTFATGLEEANRDFVAKSTGVQNLAQLNTGIVSTYDSTDPDKRTTTEENISGFFSGDLNDLNIGGILESEIIQNSEPHIMTFNVAAGGAVDNGDGFSFVSGVDKPDFLKFIKLGSPYRFDLKDASDILYKIDSIKENNPNEYLVSAAKFDTGKFSLIEDNISLDKKENTYDYNVATTIGDITYSGLKAPENLSITTGVGTETDTFFISGDWDEVAEKSSYNYVLSFPSSSKVSESTTNESVKFDNLSSIGNYALSVKAIGSSSDTLKTTDSEFSTVRTFILYQALEDFDRSFITNVTFS